MSSIVLVSFCNKSSKIKKERMYYAYNSRSLSITVVKSRQEPGAADHIYRQEWRERMCLHSWLSPLSPLSLHSSGPSQRMALPALRLTFSTPILMTTNMPPGQSDSDNPSFRVSSQVIQAWGKLAIKAHCINGAVNGQVNSIWVVGWWGTFWIA